MVDWGTQRATKRPKERRNEEKRDLVSFAFKEFLREKAVFFAKKRRDNSG